MPNMRHVRRWLSAGIAVVGCALMSGQTLASSMILDMDVAPRSRSFVTTAGDPANYIISPGGEYSGVGDVIINDSSRCSGSLLTTGRHVLTAAHCVTDNAGELDVNTLLTTFETVGGDETYGFSAIDVHPLYDGSLGSDYDLAVVALSAQASANVARYGLYRDSDEIGQDFEKVGYGRSGTGDDGDILDSGTKRAGQNTYELNGIDDVDDNPIVTSGHLIYDFDNGLAANDAFFVYFGISHLGLGLDEVNVAPGDSGGAGFLRGSNDELLIAGVTSFGLTFLESGSPDVTPTALDSSFGEISADVRVSINAAWIDSITAPEPASLGLFGLGLLALGLGRRRAG